MFIHVKISLISNHFCAEMLIVQYVIFIITLMDPVDFVYDKSCKLTSWFRRCLSFMFGIFIF